MTIREFIDKFKSKMLWGNLIAMAAVVAALAFGFKYAVDVYTHHGKSIVIPNLIHTKYDNAYVALQNLGLEIEVSDTGYVKTLPAGCILEQFPAAGECVKPGRTVYITINATNTPTITLPDVIDNSSLREAMARLTSMGFKLSTPQFIAGEKDWVYGITVNGRHVVAGDRIPVDARLTILVGNGLRDESDSVNYVDPDIPDIEEEEGDIDEFEEVTAPEESTTEQTPGSPSTPTEKE